MAIPITLRKKIADFDPIREGITVQQFCKNIGVSKQTYYNIKARIAERGARTPESGHGDLIKMR